MRSLSSCAILSSSSILPAGTHVPGVALFRFDLRWFPLLRLSYHGVREIDSPENDEDAPCLLDDGDAYRFLVPVEVSQDDLGEGASRDDDRTMTGSFTLFFTSLTFLYSRGEDALHAPANLSGTTPATA
jgi:hypothetical protein